MRTFTPLHAASLLALAMAALPSQAQELGRVISSTPVIQQVSVPRQVCTQQQVTVPESKSGAGAVLGAVAGGAAGNAIGDGGGRAMATFIGIVGGALLGNKIEGSTGSRIENVEQCTTQNFYENRTMAYNVVYEYAGKQYNVQMPQDPGQWVKLQVTPAANQGVAPAAPAMSSGPVSLNSPPVTLIRSEVIVPAPVVYSTSYVSAYPPSYYPAYDYRNPALSIGFVYNYSHGRDSYRGHRRHLN